MSPPPPPPGWGMNHLQEEKWGPALPSSLHPWSFSSLQLAKQGFEPSDWAVMGMEWKLL